MSVRAALFLLAAVASLAAPPKKAPLLARNVRAFAGHGESRLSALVRFGRQNDIRFGLEFWEDDLAKPFRGEFANAQTAAAIRSILGPGIPVGLSVLHGTVLICREGAASPAWLDEKLPKFTIQRTDLVWAHIVLYMTLEHMHDPKGGVAPPGNPDDKVGPLDLRNVTVRDALCRLVGSCHRTGWMVTVQGASVGGPASINRYWTLIWDRNPMDELPSVPLPKAPQPLLSPD